MPNRLGGRKNQESIYSSTMGYGVGEGNINANVITYALKSRTPSYTGDSDAYVALFYFKFLKDGSEIPDGTKIIEHESDNTDFNIGFGSNGSSASYEYSEDDDSIDIRPLFNIDTSSVNVAPATYTVSYYDSYDETTKTYGTHIVNKDTKVVISSYDAICSFIGSGVNDEGESSDVSGTVTVFRTLTRKETCKSSKIYSMPYYNENAKIIGGSNNLGGGLIEWGTQGYYLNDEYPYEIMEKDAAESDIGARGLVFLPFLLGERAPIWNDNARGVFFGLERMHTRKDMTRAVFESTGFIDLSIIDAIKETGTDVSSVRLSGGLARINLISQIKADVLGKDVLVLSEFETTASGAAMMVLTGQNIYPDMKSSSDKFSTVRMIIKPNMENNKKYMYMYELYKESYKALKPLFKKRKELIDKLSNDKEIQIENL